MTSHRNRLGYRHCNRCHTEFPLSSDYFPSDKNRTSGLGYQCRECANRIRRERGDPRKNRWASMTPEQRSQKYEMSRRYARTDKGRAIVMINAYRHFDKRRGYTCDLEPEWMMENIFPKPCYYCGDTEAKIGCDRIDNRRGHSIDNVVPCCQACNSVRMDHFSHEEMTILGEAIRNVKAARLIVIRPQNA